MQYRRIILVAAFLTYLLIVIAPLGVAFWTPQGETLARRPLLDDFGSSLAMVGFAAILVEFLLLGRFRTLSTSLGSDFLMQAHQLLARTALAFVLVHPFLYSLWGETHRSSDPTFASALRIEPLSLLTGAVAWILMIAIVYGATHRSQPGANYDRWRAWHAITASAIVATALHHALAAGRYTSLTPLHWVWWALAGLAGAALIVVHVLRPMLQRRTPYAIEAVRSAANGIYELMIVPKQNRPWLFKPGQFAWIKIGSIRATRDHPFSIASSPNAEGRLRFLIKSMGDFTSAIAQTPPGATVYVDGPHGHFAIPDHAPSIIMIAGGIGIAPFCSLLQACAERGDARPIRLIYGNRLASQQVDVQRLAQTEGLGDFRMTCVIGEPLPGDQGVTGQLDASTLQQILQRPEFAAHRDTSIYLVCGPAVMIDAVETTLVGLGIPLSKIVSEKFQYDFDLHAPRSRRTLGIWLLASAMLLAGAWMAASR